MSGMRRQTGGVGSLKVVCFTQSEQAFEAVSLTIAQIY